MHVHVPQSFLWQAHARQFSNIQQKLMSSLGSLERDYNGIQVKRHLTLPLSLNLICHFQAFGLCMQGIKSASYVVRIIISFALLGIYIHHDNAWYVNTSTVYNLNSTMNLTHLRSPMVTIPFSPLSEKRRELRVKMHLTMTNWKLL